MFGETKMLIYSCLFLLCFCSILGRPVDDNLESNSTEKKLEELLETVDRLNAKSGAETIPINDEEIEDGLIYKSEIKTTTLSERQRLVTTESSSDLKVAFVHTTVADVSDDVTQDHEELEKQSAKINLKRDNLNPPLSEEDVGSSSSYPSEVDKTGDTEETNEELIEDKDQKTGQQFPQDEGNKYCEHTDEDGPHHLETRRMMTGESEQDDVGKSDDENSKTEENLDKDFEAVHSRTGFPTNLDLYQDEPQPATSNPLPPALIFRHNPFLVNRVTDAQQHPDLETQQARLNSLNNFYGIANSRRTDNTHQFVPNIRNQFEKTGDTNEDYPQEGYVPKKISDYENTNANNYVYVPNQTFRRSFSGDGFSSENLVFKKLAQATGFRSPIEANAPRSSDHKNLHSFGVRNGFGFHPYHSGHHHTFFVGSTPSYFSQFQF